MEFDYIIVGAGSAGCVLAGRLTEDKNTRVLLLEAGKPDSSPLIRMPAGIGQLVPEETYNWFYYTEPEPHLKDRRLFWPRGKTLGGSSSINAMVYIRGNARDYDDWAQKGARGWSYAEVLPYFRRAEHWERGANTYHGGEGPLNVTSNHWEDTLTEAFLKAGDERGYRRTDDFNGAMQEGFAYYDSTTKGGNRCSAAAAYLKPALNRKNLKVVTEAQASRILFDGRRAVGIEYRRAEGKIAEVFQAMARREVILSGGAINSPQLLMLSGIGPAEHLHGMELGVVHDLPGVGKNLQDHLDCCLQYEATQPVTAFRFTSPLNKMKLFFQWRLFGGGYGSFIPVPVGAFIKSSPDLEVPDLQLHFMSIMSPAHGFEKPTGHGFQCHVCQLNPKSVGEILLASNDPGQHPKIHANYLSDPDDLRVMRRGVEITRDLMMSQALAPYRGAEVWPGPAMASQQALDEAIRAHGETLYHPVGTCRMGGDFNAVVDEQLRVHGVEALRVVDASIMPHVVAGNTNAPTIMIAEKAADMIQGKPPLERAAL